MAALKIAIIGAGPAGCMLARLLTQSGKDISVTIFEGESSIDLRSQGGTLDLHTTSGQAAMKAAGLWDEFQAHARYDGEAMQLADKKYLCYVRQDGAKQGKSVTGRPEIDRPKLREILFNSLPEGIVKWGHKLTQIDDNLVLHFTNGNTEKGFDLIVGADGAWSKVRPKLTNVRPYYSGMGGHAFSIPNAEKEHPELYKRVNRGSLFSFSDGRSIMAQQMGDGSINIGTWSVRPEGWQNTCGYDVRNGAAVKEACKKDYADWDPRLLAFLLAAQEDKIAPRDLFMLPIGDRWDHVTGVTMIGDASHLMTPFAGEGVNLAFSDCLDLSKAILTAAAQSQPGRDPRDMLDAEVKNFEETMFIRSKETMQLTYDMMTAMYFTPGAPRVGIERYICRAIEGEMGPFLMTLLTPLVYAWFFIFKCIW